MLPKIPALWQVFAHPKKAACLSLAVNEKCVGSHNDQWGQGGKLVSSPGFLQESPKRHGSYTANSSLFILGSQGHKAVTGPPGLPMAKRNGLLANNENWWFNGLVGGNPSHGSRLPGKKLLLFQYLAWLKGLETAPTRNASKFRIKVYVYYSGTLKLMALKATDITVKYFLYNRLTGRIRST